MLTVIAYFYHGPERDVKDGKRTDETDKSQVQPSSFRTAHGAIILSALNEQKTSRTNSARS